MAYTKYDKKKAPRFILTNEGRDFLNIHGKEANKPKRLTAWDKYLDEKGICLDDCLELDFLTEVKEQP